MCGCFKCRWGILSSIRRTPMAWRDSDSYIMAAQVAEIFTEKGIPWNGLLSRFRHEKRALIKKPQEQNIGDRHKQNYLSKVYPSSLRPWGKRNGVPNGFLAENRNLWVIERYTVVRTLPYKSLLYPERWTVLADQSALFSTDLGLSPHKHTIGLQYSYRSIT